VVAEPLSQPELAAAIGRVVGQKVVADPGQVFGFIGAKGGVGTTTVAVNIATCLGGIVKPGRALLLDMHQGGDSAIFVGAEPRFSVLNAVENIHRLDQNLLRSLVVQVAPQLDLLASPERFGAGHVETTQFRTLLDFLAASYKYTVIDLPRSDGAVLDGLEHVSKLFVVVNQELATVKSASRLAGMLRDRYGRDKVSVVLTRSDRQADIGHADVEKAVGSPVTVTFPSDYRLALQALNKGRPIALDNHNDLSASFTKFARTLAGVRAESATSTRSSLFGRLTSRS
jgi:pilus assembly protein CpaE